MNVIIASRFRVLTTRRDEILFERAARGPLNRDTRLVQLNREILRQIDNTISLAVRWSDEPILVTHVHHPIFPPTRAAA